MTVELKQIVEALLFTADRPLAVREIRRLIAEAHDESNPAVTDAFRQVRDAQVTSALETLKVEYDTSARSYQLVEIAGGWRLVSRPQFAPWIKGLLDEQRPYRLSAPALETLAIIALRQPISRAEIAAIRGVDVDGVIKTLLERDLITITGRAENVPGKPMLYGTTTKFLEHFGLRSLDDMPKADELRAQAAALRKAEQRAEAATSAAAAPACAAALAESATNGESNLDEGQTASNPTPH